MEKKEKRKIQFKRIFKWFFLIALIAIFACIALYAEKESFDKMEAEKVNTGDEIKDINNKLLKTQKDLQNLYSIIIELQDTNLNLNSEVEKLKTEKEYRDINYTAIRLISTTLDIKNLIKNDKTFAEELRSLKILANGNQFINSEIEILQEFSTKKVDSESEINKNFQNDLYILIKTVETPEKSDFYSKTSDLLKNFITIRKITADKNINERDYYILKIEQAIKNKDYELALNRINSNERFSKNFLKTKESIENYIKVETALNEILDYVIKSADKDL